VYALSAPATCGYTTGNVFTRDSTEMLHFQRGPGANPPKYTPDFLCILVTKNGIIDIPWNESEEIDGPVYAGNGSFLWALTSKASIAEETKT